MITVTFKCDKYGDHTASPDMLIDEQTKYYGNDEEYEAAAFVEECTEFPIIFSDLDVLTVLKNKQTREINQLEILLFGEED